MLYYDWLLHAVCCLVVVFIGLVAACGFVCRWLRFGLLGCGLRLLVSRFGLSWLGFVSRRIVIWVGLIVCLPLWWPVYGFIVFNSVGKYTFYFEL